MIVTAAERRAQVWDVAIVGAGPAGAAAAMQLARSGSTVLLVDKYDFPRDKVCGDALIPDALRALETLGLYEAVSEHGFRTRRLTVFSPSRIRVELEGEFLIIRRKVLDHVLVQHAIACGASLRIGEVTDVQTEARGGVTLSFRGEQHAIRAKVVMLATGANVTLPNKVGMITRRRPSAAALRCYVRSPVDMDQLIVSYDRVILPGYAWIFPLGNNEYNVGCGVFYGAPASKKVDLRKAFHRFVTQVPIAQDLMERAEHVTPLRGATIRAGLGGANAYIGTAVLPLGECIGTTYPFTGEGIGKALETGMIGAQCVRQALETGELEPLREFPTRIERELAPRYVGYEIAQNWVAKSWLADLVARRVQRSPKLKRIANGVIQETVDPRRLFSWRLFVPGWLNSLPHA